MESTDYVAARGPALERFAYVLTGDPHLAQDLTQIALLKAYRRWRWVARGEHPDAYVRRIVTTSFLDWRRRSSGEVSARSSAPVACSEEGQVLPTLSTSGPRPEVAAARIRFSRSDQGDDLDVDLDPGPPQAATAGISGAIATVAEASLRSIRTSLSSGVRRTGSGRGARGEAW